MTADAKETEASLHAFLRGTWKKKVSGVFLLMKWRDFFRSLTSHIEQ